jgi:hypothetical protein
LNINADEDDMNSDKKSVDVEMDMTKWGQKRAYFGADFVDDELGDTDEEELEKAALEEETAREMQKRAASTLRTDDFDDTFAGLIARGTTRKLDTKPLATTTTTTSATAETTPVTTLTKDLQALTTSDATGATVEHIGTDVAALSREEKLRILENDSPELLRLLPTLRDKIVELRERIHPILTKVRSGQLPTSKGVSYLEVKNQLLLNYCMNLCFYLALKASGRRVKDHPVITQLLRTRTLLEKLRPLDQKLRYQVDKLLKIATLGKAAASAADPKLKYKANLRDFVSSSEAAAPTPEASATDERSVEQKYVVPKIAPLAYEETDRKSEQRRQRQKERAAQSAMAQFLTAEFSAQPESQHVSGLPLSGTNATQSRIEREAQQREAYEEEHFIRLQLTRKQQKALREQRKLKGTLPDELKELEDWSDLQALDVPPSSTSLSSQPVSSPSDNSKKRTLASILNELEQTTEPRQGMSLSGDDDILSPSKGNKRQKLNEESERPLKETVNDTDQKKTEKTKTKKKKKNKATSVSPTVEKSVEQQKTSTATVDEDEFYLQVKHEQEEKKKQRLQERERQRQMPPKVLYLDDTVPDGEKRKINYVIEKNKGLTRKQPKVNRNPRVKLRHKYLKALKRRTGQIAPLRDKSKPYEGERAGIKSKVVRSIPLED